MIRSPVVPYPPLGSRTSRRARCSRGGRTNLSNWKIDQAAWGEAGGYTAGPNGDGKTIYAEIEVGKGRIRVPGALLPDPTEKFYHPYGLQNYAVTYTGYTLLQNMLK